jgi:hypothetical protein
MFIRSRYPVIIIERDDVNILIKIKEALILVVVFLMVLFLGL